MKLTYTSNKPLSKKEIQELHDNGSIAYINQISLSGNSRKGKNKESNK